MAHLYAHATVKRAPEARLNAASFAKGSLLVTVEFGDLGGSYLAFQTAEEIEPFIEAFQQARALANQGAADLLANAAGAEA